MSISLHLICYPSPRADDSPPQLTAKTTKTFLKRPDTVQVLKTLFPIVTFNLNLIQKSKQKERNIHKPAFREEIFAKRHLVKHACLRIFGFLPLLNKLKYSAFALRYYLMTRYYCGPTLHIFILALNFFQDFVSRPHFHEDGVSTKKQHSKRIKIKDCTCTQFNFRQPI